MEETDLEKQLREMRVPPARKERRKETQDQAWWRLRKARKSLHGFNSPASRVASILLISGILLGMLSYTVTQSTRSGGGDAGGETSLIGSAQITQYPASVRTSIVRMIISGTEVEKLRFNRPDEFEALDDLSVAVFHPQGGGATYVQAPPDIMQHGHEGMWSYNAELAVTRIGTDDVDLVAYLVGITRSVCSKINDELGIAGVPKLEENLSPYYLKRMVDDGVSDYKFPVADHAFLSHSALSGQPFGCFQSYDGKSYVYYHVLIER